MAKRKTPHENSLDVDGAWTSQQACCFVNKKGFTAFYVA